MHEDNVEDFPLTFSSLVRKCENFKCFPVKTIISTEHCWNVISIYRFIFATWWYLQNLFHHQVKKWLSSNWKETIWTLNVSICFWNSFSSRDFHIGNVCYSANESLPSYHYPSPQTYLSDNTIPITGTPPPIWKWMRVGEGARKAKIGGRHRTGPGRIRPDGGSLPRNEGFQALLVVTEFSTFLFSPPLYIIFSFLCCLRIFLVPTLLPSLSLPFLEPSVYAKLDLKDFPIKKGIFKVFF